MQRIFLILKEIYSNLFITLIVLFSIIISIFSVGAFILTGLNFNNYINNKFATSIPPNVIKVSPKSSPTTLPTFGFLKITTKKRPGYVLDENSLRKIKSMKGVKTIHPLIASQIPMQAVVSIFGLNYRTDLVCIGVPYEFLSKDVSERKYIKLWQKWKPGDEIPSLMPKILLEAYNSSMAEPNGLPKITEDFAKGRTYQILFGRSSIKTIPGYEVQNSVLLGFTDKIANLALVLPIGVVQYYNAKFKGQNSDKEYMYAFVHVDNHDSLLSVSENIKKMNFIVETEKTISKEIIALKNNVNLVLKGLSFIIIILSIISIGFSTTIATMNRIEYYRILRILGASKLFITLTILIKYAFLGLIGYYFGFFILNYIANIITKTINITGFVINLSFPEELQKQIFILGIVIPVLATLPTLIKLYTKGLSQE